MRVLLALLMCLAIPMSAQVLSQQKISDTAGGFFGSLANSDLFGFSTIGVGDVNGDSIADLAVGAINDDDGGSDRGALWLLLLNPDGTINTYRKISDTAGGFTGLLADDDFFGGSVASIGDLNKDGVGDLAVGAYGDNDGGSDRGAVWVLFLNPGGTVKAQQKISTLEGGFSGGLDNGDLFGFSVAEIGDINGDGSSDLAVGAPFDGDGGPSRGAVWVLFLNSDGTVKAYQKISDIAGGFSGPLANGDQFGCSVVRAGDFDADGVDEIAVGAPFDSDGGPSRGAVWVLFLNSDGTVKAYQKISDIAGGFTGALDDNDFFGNSLAHPGDIDGNGVDDLLVGAYGDDDGGSFRGALWTLLLNSDGTVKSQQKISDTAGKFTGILENDDQFGFSAAKIGDIDGDGRLEIAVGSIGDDDGGVDRGGVWVLFSEYPAVPEAPSALFGTSSKVMITLTWQDNANNETGFEIQRKQESDLFTTVGYAGANVTSYTDMADLRKVYTYRVRALGSGPIDSDFSNQVIVTTGKDSDRNCGATGIELLLFLLLLAIGKKFSFQRIELGC